MYESSSWARNWLRFGIICLFIIAIYIWPAITIGSALAHNILANQPQSCGQLNIASEVISCTNALSEQANQVYVKCIFGSLVAFALVYGYLGFVFGPWLRNKAEENVHIDWHA